uniref:Uncharacterized protein n=1 Tax=Musa acuminata subsp. malaccensis TaxID=214687 RepID=A0A804I8W0_MUSAM|nr:PREDICTED: uncharacterized protein LOC103977437 [Musa acuminata subsp. malaccensis]
MDLLEVPLEAVALRLYSLPSYAAGSVWAWAAVLAAALGIWGIRTVGSRSDASPPPPPLNVPALPAERAEPQASAATDRKEFRPIAQPSGCHVKETNAAKAPFTAYYHGASRDGCGVVEDDDESEEGEEDGVPGVGCRATALWDGGRQLDWLTARQRRRPDDLGWYRYQDMAALNGSVVRLWDGGLTARRRPQQKPFYETATCEV